MRFGASTLRGQFLLIVIAGAIIPLGLLALWLAWTGVRSGERLLYQHLDQSGEQFAAEINRRWSYRQGYLLYLAGNEVTTGAVKRGFMSTADSLFLEQAMLQVNETIPSVEVTDSGGRVLWRSNPAIPPPSERRARAEQGSNTAQGGTFSVSYTISSDAGRSTVGVLRATVATSGIIGDAVQPLVPRARLGVRQTATNLILAPVHPEMAFPSKSRVTIGSEEWLTRTRVLDEAGLEIVLAAPLAPYVDPSRAAGRVGIIALILVGCVVLILTVLLTTRITRPLRELADAADGVSRGELDQRVETGGPLELRRVGGAFNVMTASLRSTLDELSEHNAMVALGKFATALSHDVRNALTSIKVDVERTVHRPMDESRGSAVLQRVLNNVARLDALVSGALRIARGEHMTLVDVDLRLPVRAAAEMVAGAFAVVPATLSIEIPDEPVMLNADASALEQLLANILFNAAQAVRPGGEARVRIVRDNAAIVIEISDDGIGMDDAQIARTQQPFHSSRSNGTGLGLPIARQIAAAHSGELVVASQPGCGTTVQLRLPACVESQDSGQ